MIPWSLDGHSEPARGALLMLFVLFCYSETVNALS